MKYREVVATLGYLLMLFSSTFILPMIVGAYYNEGAVFIYKAYFLPLLFTFTTGLILWYNSRHEVHNLRERDAYVVVGLGWVIIAFFGALSEQIADDERERLRIEKEMKKDEDEDNI